MTISVAACRANALGEISETLGARRWLSSHHLSCMEKHVELPHMHNGTVQSGHFFPMHKLWALALPRACRRSRSLMLSGCGRLT